MIVSIFQFFLMVLIVIVVISRLWQETPKEHECARGKLGMLRSQIATGFLTTLVRHRSHVPLLPLHHLVRVISPFRSFLGLPFDIPPAFSANNTILTEPTSHFTAATNSKPPFLANTFFVAGDP